MKRSTSSFSVLHGVSSPALTPVRRIAELMPGNSGGVDYLSFADPAAASSSSSSYPLSAILPVHGKQLFDLCTTLTPNIAYYLPRNINVDELGALARPLQEGEAMLDGTGGKPREREWVEVEEQWVGDKLKAVTAYYGGLIADE